MKFNELSANKNRKYNGIERPKTSPENISELMDDEIFVFGSNLQGAHGGGAALVAKKLFGAIQGQGTGLQGLFISPQKYTSISIQKYTILI